MLCQNEYEWFKVADTSWLRQHLSVSYEGLQDIKRIYSVKHVDYDAIFESVSVLTRPHRPKHTIHMFFELYRIRSFMNCQQQGNRLIGISVQVT